MVRLTGRNCTYNCKYGIQEKECSLTLMYYVLIPVSIQMISQTQHVWTTSANAIVTHSFQPSNPNSNDISITDLYTYARRNITHSLHIWSYIMNDTRDAISSNLALLRKERAANRVLRAKMTFANEGNAIADRLTSEFDSYIAAPLASRPIYGPNIATMFYGDPPPAPVITQDNRALTALTFLYPIGEKEDGTWYIVSPMLFIKQPCGYTPDWENHQMRIKAVLFHAAKLMVILARLLGKKLPHPVTIDGSNATIRVNGVEYNVLWYDEWRRDFFIGLKRLNENAYFLGGVEADHLLENLHRALEPYMKRPSQQNLSASAFLGTGSGG